MGEQDIVHSPITNFTDYGGIWREKMTTTAIIKKIDPPKVSFNGDVVYKRVYFELQDGSFAETDIVPTFRNFKYWRPIILAGIGTRIDGVRLKYPGKVDADSKVFIYQNQLFPKKSREEEEKELLMAAMR